MTRVAFEDWERQRLDRAVGVVSTVSPDGGPHSAPVVVWLEGDDLRFETEPEARKYRNLVANPRVALCVYGQPKWGVVVRGMAEVMTPAHDAPPGPHRGPDAGPETGGGTGSGNVQIVVHPTSKASWRKKEG